MQRIVPIVTVFVNGGVVVDGGMGVALRFQLSHLIFRVLKLISHCLQLLHKQCLAYVVHVCLCACFLGKLPQN